MRIMRNPALAALAAVAALALVSAAAAEPVKITNIGHGYYSGALYVAKQEKLFEKHGLEPDISFVQGGALALQAALTKQADVSILSYEHILTAGVQGKRIVAFYNICNRPVNNVIASEKLLAGAEKLGVEDKIKRLKGQRWQCRRRMARVRRCWACWRRNTASPCRATSAASISAPRRRPTWRPSSAS
jgi:ABC-type nitrate/sulfonate/bicarbonate transport system substrate-binding protein